MINYNDLLIREEDFNDFSRACNVYSQNSSKEEIDDFFNILKNKPLNQVFVKKSITTDLEKIVQELTENLQSIDQKIHGAIVTVFSSDKTNNHYIYEYLEDELCNLCSNNSAILWTFARQEKWPEEFIEVVMIYS